MNGNYPFDSVPAGVENGSLANADNSETEQYRPFVSKVRVNVLASPAMAADSIARTLSSAGWRIGHVASSMSELAGYEAHFEAGDILLAVEGVIPASVIAKEIRNRVPGVRSIVVTDDVHPYDVDAVTVPTSTEVRTMLRQLERFEAAPVNEAVLTSRHLEILTLIASGLSTDEVGKSLGIASKTVNNHLSAVYRRLNARNLTQAVLRAARAGLIDLSPM